MKKIRSITVVLGLVALLAVLLAGCGGDTIVPGSNWAQKETFTYDITDSGTKIGTLTITSEKLEEGSYTVPQIREEPFKITSSVMRGVRYEQTARDNDGNVIMHSISLMNGFSPLASYKKIDIDDRISETRGYVQGKEYRYLSGDGSWQKIKIKPAQFVDNEILYMSMRSYSEIDDGYSKAITTIDPSTGTQEEITAATTGVKANYDVNYTDTYGELKKKTVSCLQINFAKSTSPSGTPISVWYTEGGFEVSGTPSAGAVNISKYIPVLINENNLTYTLTSVVVD